MQNRYADLFPLGVTSLRSVYLALLNQSPSVLLFPEDIPIQRKCNSYRSYLPRSCVEVLVTFMQEYSSQVPLPVLRGDAIYPAMQNSLQDQHYYYGSRRISVKSPDIPMSGKEAQVCYDLAKAGSHQAVRKFTTLQENKTYATCVSHLPVA